MVAVRGTARRAPRSPPRMRLQARTETMTVRGWRPTDSPTILGAIKIPSILFARMKMAVTTRGWVQSPNWAAAMMTAGM